MPRTFLRPGRPAGLVLLAAFATLLVAGPAAAVIKALIPLKEVLNGEEFIFIAQVDAVDAAKPSVVFTFAENLKGKAPFERIAVNLTGDSFAKKDNHTKEMLDRLAAKRQLVFFSSKVGKDYSAFGYMDGTWFQLRGVTDPDGKTVRWAFLHCEPYFRRTFKGTTDELKTVVTECLAGKRKPPEPDEKEPPGYGTKPEKPADGKNSRVVPSGSVPGAASPALFGVIPSFVLIGPLAIIAALFPGVFARLAVGMKRWRAFLTVASTNSTLALAYFWLRSYLPDTFWFSAQAFAIYLLAGTLVGLLWAGRRYRQAAALEPDVSAPPARTEILGLLGVTALTAVSVALTGWWAGWGEVIQMPWKEFTGIGVGLAAATAYALYRAATQRIDVGSDSKPLPIRLSLAGEAVGLSALAVFSATVLTVTWPREHGPVDLAGEVGEAVSTEGDSGPKLVDAKLFFETPDFHEIMSSANVTGDKIYFGASKTTGFRGSGAVFCLDRATGAEAWRFTDDGGLMPVFATPAVAGGQVFAGEGLHTDVERRLFRLDAATGKPSWPAPVATTSHTEGSPRVANGKVYFSAGDDGLFCVNTETGKEAWHLKGSEQKLHIDTPPAVAKGMVFLGSGYLTFAMLGLNAETGAEVWRTPAPYRSFGAPLVIGDKVVYGLGTGNLTTDLATESEPGIPTETKPAGAVVCLEAATGKEVWRYDTPKSVHTATAADARTVYAACRDGFVYALDRKTGKLRWKRSLGSALTAGPAVAAYAGGALSLAVYAVSSEGLVACLSPADGKVLWTRDLRSQTGREVQVLSTPVVVSGDGSGTTRHVFIGSMLTNKNNAAKTAALFRIEDTVGE
ncbi:PQQ-binding-like beta-propeller repeat protein [Fimbriiglobus ruber]|uniref:Cell surface protein n=1 Tax=Fimbriiglobus ruber TaxID=1908690 RepID=A0A225DPH6_9BACT|nr:PQQ-binding-like beta-propeller repeat protein [Fimbriiglobus ruber]OWK43292.1 cell surface protein [Fimbriiglobus ruber]